MTVEDKETADKSIVREDLLGGELPDWPTAVSWKTFVPVPDEPEGTLLVGGYSSTFCLKKIDSSKHEVIYAGAQNNAGPAGFGHHHRARRPSWQRAARSAYGIWLEDIRPCARCA